MLAVVHSGVSSHPQGVVFLLFLKSALGIVIRNRGVRSFLSYCVGLRG